MIKIELGDFDYAKIIPLSDLHIGDPDFDEKNLTKISKTSRRR